jgi:hypothetical protein
MVGWILLIAVAVIMLYAADAVIYVVTWMVAYIDAALSPLGIRLEVFDYLDLIYPYFRSTIQALAVGVILIAVFHITLSIKERT